jgi:hypothetical protein
MAEADDREGFLARWSRRKREAREGGEPAEPDPPAPPPPAGQAAPPAEAEEPIDLSALPKLEDLTPSSDITAFLRKGVPLSLRNAALRRIWSLDPAIRDYIGPVDYGWDWNTPGGVPDYVADIGETPVIRQLVERMLAPAPRPSLADRPEPEPTPLHRGDPPAEPVPPIAPPVAVAADPPPTAPAASPEASADASASSGRPRHGGALPV